MIILLITNIYLYADHDEGVKVKDIHELKESEIDIDEILKSLGIKVDEDDDLDENEDEHNDENNEQ